eukprot:767793-Hanusia_phi.AAC.3
MPSCVTKATRPAGNFPSLEGPIRFQLQLSPHNRRRPDSPERPPGGRAAAAPEPRRRTGVTEPGGPGGPDKGRACGGGRLSLSLTP